MVETKRLNGSRQRTHHISKGCCYSSVLFLCHVAVCELSPPHTGSALLAEAEGKSEWISLGYTLGCFVPGDPDDALHLFLSSKGSSQIPVSENS